MDCTPTTFMNFQSTYTLSPPTDPAAKPWKFDMSLLPHPIAFLYSRSSNIDDMYTTNQNFLNQQIPGDTHNMKYRNFIGLFEKWRLCYMSVTVYQDAPALANQGTIVVSQPAVMPRRVFSGLSNYNYSDLATVTTACLPKLNSYDLADYPDYLKSQALPNSYFARSDAGCYVPLKLTNTCQHWHSEEDSVMNALNNVNLIPSSVRQYAINAGGVGIRGVATVDNLPAVGDFPFPSLLPLVRVGSIPTPGLNSTAIMVGEFTSDMCNDNWAHISARNLSPACSYSFFVRAGYEVTVNATSAMSPQLRLSPPYDPTALRSYFAISRELKDAYPADYNDLGKIWEEIKSAAAGVYPLIKHIPVVGPLAEALQPGVKAGISVLEKALKPSSARDTPPAAAIERARKAVVSSPSTRKRKPPAKKKKKPNRR